MGLAPDTPERIAVKQMINEVELMEQFGWTERQLKEDTSVGTLTRLCLWGSAKSAKARLDAKRLERQMRQR